MFNPETRWGRMQADMVAAKNALPEGIYPRCSRTFDAILARVSHEDGVAVVSLRTLEEETGLKRPTIRRAIDDLRAHGMLEVETRTVPGRGQLSSRYIIPGYAGEQTRVPAVEGRALETTDTEPVTDTVEADPVRAWAAREGAKMTALAHKTGIVFGDVDDLDAVEAHTAAAAEALHALATTVPVGQDGQPVFDEPLQMSGVVGFLRPLLADPSMRRSILARPSIMWMQADRLLDAHNHVPA